MSAKLKGVGCLLLFALPFAAGGTFIGWVAVSGLAEWVEVRSWMEVPARILEVELEEHRGDDSTTYRVTATYEYEAFGETYRSSRVTFTDWADNVGSFHVDKYRELAAYRGSGEVFRCFVNPADPAESILYRELRWGMLGLMTVFALVFGGVGYGLVFAAWYGKRSLDAEELVEEAHPRQPWLWEQRWRDGRVQASSKTQLIFTAVFAVLWNLISAPALFFVPAELAAGNRLALLALLFPAVGAGLLAWAGVLLVRWRKFGASVFEMARVPGVVGGLLEGRVVTSVRPLPGRFKLTLSCRRTTRSGKSSTTRILWQDVDEVDRGRLGMGPAGAVVPVRFAIPYGVEESSSDDSGPDVDWRLEVESEVPGVDYGASFEVPVFRTPDSDPEFERREAERASVEQATFAAGAVAGRPRHLLDAGIVLEPLPSGARRYTFRPARHKGAALGLTAFTALWGACTWATVHFGAPLLFPLGFGFFELLLLLATLDMWFGMRRVEIGPATLMYSGGLFGLGPRRTIARGDIVELDTARGNQAGNHLFYRIRARTRDGKSHLLAKQLDDLRLAERLVREFQRLDN